MTRFLAFSLLFGTMAHAQGAQVRQEGERFWVQCQSASLEDVIREIAALSPMELWLDEGLSGKRVTAKIERATLKQALEELFEEVTDVNYVFTFDQSNPERVTKIYAGGGGGGRLSREPTVAAAEAEELPEDTDVMTVEEGSGETETSSEELEDVLEDFPELPEVVPPTKPRKKEKPHP